MKALKTIYSSAPIRVCDIGGWTDTWFAEYGTIFNIAVSPHADVQIDVFPRNSREKQVMLIAENYDDHYHIDLEQSDWGKHPLLEATIQHIGIPEEFAVDIHLYSEAPAGASVGTSAAVTVSLIAALDKLSPNQLTAHEIAYAAHHIESTLLGRQSGIQDQLAAAYGGINYIDMFTYPRASISQLDLANPIWWELNRRLMLIYLGTSHDSSQVHEHVISNLEDVGSEAPALKALRTTASQAKEAIMTGDFATFGQVMTRNTDMQRDLHPALISEDAQQIIDIARHYAALGWKVNGAGGEGGSLTLLGGDSTAKQREMIRAIIAENPKFEHIPIQLSRFGACAWEIRST